jgi:hypothetical protein
MPESPRVWTEAELATRKVEIPRLLAAYRKARRRDPEQAVLVATELLLDYEISVGPDPNVLPEGR